MAIAIGNTTNANPIPGATSYTLSHTHNVGADGVLLVALCMFNTVDYSGVTYNGVAMTERLNYNSGSLSQRWAFYELANPATGANNIVITFTGTQWNPLSVAAQSFTGATTGGVVGNDDSEATPNSKNLTIATNSIIYLMGVSTQTQSSGYDINASTRTNLFAHNTYRQVEAALSATGIGAGSIACVTKADFGIISNIRIEIKEAGIPPATSGNFLIMF